MKLHKKDTRSAARLHDFEKAVRYQLLAVGFWSEIEAENTKKAIGGQPSALFKTS